MLSKTINAQIGKRIRQLRISRGLTQAEAGALAGLSANMISDIETGRAGLSLERLYLLCQKTGTSADYILFGGPLKSRSAREIILDVTRDMDLDELQRVSDYLVTLIHLRNNH